MMGDNTGVGLDVASCNGNVFLRVGDVVVCFDSDSARELGVALQNAADGAERELADLSGAELVQ